MKIEPIVVGALETNCYIVRGEGSSALVIDPGADPDCILQVLDKAKLNVAAYLITHAHTDHISALAEVADVRPAPIAMHGDDLRWAYGPLNAMPPFYPAPKRPLSAKDRVIRHSEEYQDAGLKCRVLHTPGHSPGSVCFHFPDQNTLFSGDTLFAGSVGRTDLPGGDLELLSQSLADLRRLPPDTAIYPGHGPSTTLRAELESNPFLA
jgi:glyoxylase-like metal-dependent hydrolase (beta-lactamase superfamily II)